MQTRRLNRLAAPCALMLALFASGCARNGAGSGDRSLISLPTSEAQTYVASAEDLVRTGDLRSALDEFTRAIEINPRLTRAHLGVADIHRIEGDFASAQVSYERAAQLEPRNPTTHYYNGLMLHLLERLGDAIQAYLRALAIDPDDFKANLHLSTAYYQLNENDQALEYAERAVRLEPNDGQARFNLAAVYASLERHEQAVLEYQQATELMELTPDLLLRLADSLGKLDRYSEMAGVLDQLVRTDPSPAAHERLGYAQFRLQEYDDAKSSFRSSLSIDPNYFPALNGLGVSRLNDWVWSDERDREARSDALKALRRSLQLNRNQPRVAELLTRYGR